MSTSTGDVVAERQRSRAARQSGNPASRTTEPPRQRRPALAALALLLVVGGALGAGLLAVRMDERQPVYAAARAIEPGTRITSEDLKEVQVASEGIGLIPSSAAEQVLGGAGVYAKVPIEENTLVDQSMLTEQAPVGEDRAIVAIQLNPALTPSELRGGDLVEVVRVSGNQEIGSEAILTEALILSVERTTSDDLGGGPQTATANLMVPASIASAVVDASGANLVGLALLERGQPTDVELQEGE